ncbi:hypothetical protein BC830DRAFT_804232 [Chytriomyces sp. MP71]|nr:hypothetical protein BC830DRAFT_804232 [Chytriomyces sp. MP71]
MSVLFDAQDGGSNATKLSLNYANGGSMDVAAYLLCTRAMVEDDGNTVAWDICAFNSEAPRGTFDGVNGATWTFVPVPEKGNGPCQVGIFEIQMHGVESVGAVISVGAMVGIVIAILALVSIGAVCFIRQSNLRKRAARWLNQPRGGWESLELWAADRADHHDNNTNNSS